MAFWRHSTRNVNYTVNVPETRTRNYNVTVYDTVTEQVPETYTVCVPVQSEKAVQVLVCKQVPVTINVPVYSYPSASMDSGASYGGEVMMDSGAGCINCGGSVVGEGAIMEPAPMATGAGCTNCNQ